MEVYKNNDEFSLCKEQSSCENCPNFDKCYSLDDEVLDDYETMEPDEFLDKYL